MFLSTKKKNKTGEKNLISLRLSLKACAHIHTQFSTLLCQSTSVVINKHLMKYFSFGLQHKNWHDTLPSLYTTVFFIRHMTANPSSFSVQWKLIDYWQVPRFKMSITSWSFLLHLFNANLRSEVLLKARDNLLLSSISQACLMYNYCCEKDIYCLVPH